MSIAHAAIRLVERLPFAGKATLDIERKIYHHYLQRVRREAGDRAYAATGGIIVSGVFAGVKLAEQMSWGQDRYATISGQYERELETIVGRACALDYGGFIDIGCANGLYAVGIAVLAKDKTVVAYDIDPDARLATEKNALLNDVAARVEVRGVASAETLAECIRRFGSAFLISDIEGAELDLLDPQDCPALLDTDLLIELHGDIPAAIATFARRFGSTHKAHVVSRLSRSPFDAACGTFASEDDAWVSVSEGRGFAERNWLFLVRLAMGDAYATAVEPPHIEAI